MSMYNLIEYSDNCPKTFGILWQCCRDEPAINPTHSKIPGFTEVNAITDSLKIKEKITDKTGDIPQKR